MHPGSGGASAAPNWENRLGAPVLAIRRESPMGRSLWTEQRMAGEGPGPRNGNLYCLYRSLASFVSAHEIWAVQPLG